MVERKRVSLVDDLDGSPARHTVRFALDGVAYEIDLNGDNATALRELFERYIVKARKIKSESARDSRPAGAGRADNQRVTEQIRNAAQRTRAHHEAPVPEPADDAVPTDGDGMGLFLHPPAAATRVDSATAPVELPQFSAAAGQ